MHASYKSNLVVPRPLPSFPSLAVRLSDRKPRAWDHTASDGKLGEGLGPYWKQWEAGRGPGTILEAMGSWARAWDHTGSDGKLGEGLGMKLRVYYVNNGMVD